MRARRYRHKNGIVFSSAKSWMIFLAVDGVKLCHSASSCSLDQAGEWSSGTVFLVELELIQEIYFFHIQGKLLSLLYLFVEAFDVAFLGFFMTGSSSSSLDDTITRFFFGGIEKF